MGTKGYPSDDYTLWIGKILLVSVARATVESTRLEKGRHPTTAHGVDCEALLSDQHM
jgi:hypothetical protein